MIIDPIEQTKEYKKALNKIQPELDKLNATLDARGFGMGRCHIYWETKKQLLKKEGVDWKTPAEMNPYIMFD